MTRAKTASVGARRERARMKCMKCASEDGELGLLLLRK
jgi:hypothetical protein